MVAETNGRDLVIFALGPVQSFIATARRTQDLWLGSRLLSELARVGLETADRQPDVELLYPVQEQDTEEFPDSIPNQFALLVPSGTGSDIANRIGSAIRVSWSEVAGFEDETIKAPKEEFEIAWQDLDGGMRAYFEQLAPEQEVWPKIWQRQVSDWLETYWVVWPWRDDEYGAAFANAGRALDARKQVRQFRSGEPGEKCTLCGEREVLHALDTAQFSREDLRIFWDTIRGEHPGVTIADLREGERLCAVCTIKRFAQDAPKVRDHLRAEVEERFPSTSSIAAATFRSSVLDHWKDLNQPVRTHLDLFNNLGVGHKEIALPYLDTKIDKAIETEVGAAREFIRYDGDLFYASTFTEDRLSDIVGGDRIDEDARKQALRNLKALVDAATSHDIAPPHTYFAVLAMDGDHMGRLLRAQPGPEEHQAISAALAAFADTDVPNIVEGENSGDPAEGSSDDKQRGRLIYAGGDDILALLPLADALEIADKLQETFTEVMQGFATDPDQQPTASAGIAIVHHTQPLEGGLRAARRALELAKDEYDRSAIVVEVLRRSGEARRAAMNWSYSDTLNGLAPIRDVQENVEKGKLSGKLVYDVLVEAPALGELPGEAQTAELTRLLKRHWQEDPTDEVKQRLNELAQTLFDLSQSLKTDERIGTQELTEWLLLARFLAQGGLE